MECDTVMHEEAPLGRVQEQQPPSQPTSNSNNNDNNKTHSTDHDALHIPSLASKFEELIAALPPLPMATSRPTQCVGRQGAKRRRGDAADDTLLFSTQDRTPIKIREQKQYTQLGDNTEPSPDSLYSPGPHGHLLPSSEFLLGHKIGVWLPTAAAASPSPPNANPSNTCDTTVPSSGPRKNGSYQFGRIIGHESVPPYRQLIKYDEPLGVENAYINLKNEVWVALSEGSDDQVDDIKREIIAPATKGKEAAEKTENLLEEVEHQEDRRHENKKSRPLVPPVIFENEYFSVYNTSCGPAGYEIFASFPALRLENIKLRCFGRGKVQLTVKQPLKLTPEITISSGGGDVRETQGVEELSMGAQLTIEDTIYTVDLPSRIIPETARALFTSTGQLYLRVDSEKLKN